MFRSKTMLALGVAALVTACSAKPPAAPKYKYGTATYKVINERGGTGSAVIKSDGEGHAVVTRTLGDKTTQAVYDGPKGEIYFLKENNKYDLGFFDPSARRPFFLDAPKPKKWVYKKNEKVGAYDCQVWKVSSFQAEQGSSGSGGELWRLDTYVWFSPQIGIPVKYIEPTSSATLQSYELESFDGNYLPASEFQLPAGYEQDHIIQAGIRF